MKYLAVLIALLVSNISNAADSFTFQGYPITYTAASNPAAMVIVLHGRGGNGPQIERKTQFTPLAQEKGFTVVYPSANGYWDDVPATFIPDLIAEMGTRAQVTQVFVTGMSMGGIYAYKLACDIPHLLDGVAPVAARQEESCTPATPIAIIAFNSLYDRIVPYGGTWAYPGAQASIDIFRTANNCDATPTLIEELLYTRQSYNCDEPTVLYTMESDGHRWPGTRGTSGAVKATDTIWDFFSEITTEDIPAECLQYID